MKKYIVTVAIALIALTAVITGTIAYNTVTEKAVNIVTMGNIRVKGVSSNTLSLSDMTIVPGAKTEWSFWVQNYSSEAAYVRVSASSVFTLASGVTSKEDQSLVQFEINSDAWTLKDGYYYYNKALAGGTKSEPLFKSVSFSYEAGNTYQGATAKLNVYVYAVQVKNNGSSVFEAAGWPSAN